MATKTTVTCDMCGREIYGAVTGTNIPVTFTTEQTEGRSIEPTRFSLIKMDICLECFKRVARNQPIKASGAMGNNSYMWDDKEVVKG